MSQIKIYSQLVLSLLQEAIICTQKKFNEITQQFDFAIFCFLYAILLVWLLRKFNQGAAYRPKNMELIGTFAFIKDWKTRTFKSISTFLVSLPIIKQIVQKKFQQGLNEIQVKLGEDFEKDRDRRKSKKLPQTAMSEENIKKRMLEWNDSENNRMFSGRISGGTYIDSLEWAEQINNFAAKFMYHNPLHLDTYKELSRIQAQLLRMTGAQVSKNPVFGIITSGGSESLIMSIYAYRKYFSSRTKPNIVVPNTIHAAVDKGAMYFNVQVRKARLNQKFEVDIKHMESLIDSNTIALYGSYPNYPHGIIDPINQIAKLAKKYKTGFHIDGCLGGFIAVFLKQHQKLFSLDIDGVTSVSLDHHKYGLAPKGISCLLFKKRELRRSMYYVNTDWIGAVYATPSFPGSRSGFASAGAWYALTNLGKKTFQQNALKIQNATIKVAEQLQKIEGIKVIGDPRLCVIAFYSTQVDPFSISSYLGKQKGWKISPLHLPKALHLSITLANCKNLIQKLAKDVREAIQYIKKQPQIKTATAALYGASATVPSQDMGEQMLRKIMSTTYK